MSSYVGYITLFTQNMVLNLITEVAAVAFIKEACTHLTPTVGYIYYNDLRQELLAYIIGLLTAHVPC